MNNSDNQKPKINFRIREVFMMIGSPKKRRKQYVEWTPNTEQLK
jgi:hypothetical protein